MSEPIPCDGTDLYRRTMAADYGDAERNELMKSEWTPTPWMIDAQVGDNREEIRSWCYRNLGGESSPMHRHLGAWKQASVTLHGKSWFGFRTKAIMERFELAYTSIVNEKGLP